MSQYTDLVTTLRTDYCRCVGASEYKAVRCYTCEAADALEAMAGEVERLTTNGAHTCHDQCQRPLCASYRELVAAKKHGELLNKMLGEAEAERDRLKAALNEIAGYADDRPGDWAARHARKALGDAS